MAFVKKKFRHYLAASVVEYCAIAAYILAYKTLANTPTAGMCYSVCV